MKLCLKLGWLALVCLCWNLDAHEGHDTPGALPPPPHGGVLKEAEHTGLDHHEGQEEAELFFEVIYKNKRLEIHPLLLGPKDTKAFVPLKAKQDLSKVSLKVDFPRSKKSEIVTPTLSDAITAGFDAKGANRFFVIVEAEYAKELKRAKIQVEVE